VRYTLYENGIISVTSEHERIIPEKYNGLKAKKYEIDRKAYIKLVSSCVNLYTQKRNEVIFLTLTFPSEIDEFRANRVWSNYIENLTKNYKLNAYVCVREFTQIGRPHYHALLDIPYQPIKKLNSAWCGAYIGVGGSSLVFSPNAARLPAGKNRAVVKTLGGIVRYLGKYISKSRGYDASADSRCYFVSRNVASRPRVLTESDYRAITGTFKHRLIKHDYCATVMVESTVFPNQDSQRVKELNAIMDRLIDRNKVLALIDQKKRNIELELLDLQSQYELVLKGINLIEPLEMKLEKKQKTTRKQPEKH